MSHHPNAAISVLRRDQLEGRIGLSRSAIYDRLNPKSKQYDPEFPKPIQLGSGKKPPVGWVESEVNAWLSRLIASSRGRLQCSVGIDACGVSK